MKRIGTLIRGDLEDLSTDDKVVNRTEHMLNRSRRSFHKYSMGSSPGSQDGVRQNSLGESKRRGSERRGSKQEALGGSRHSSKNLLRVRRDSEVIEVKDHDRVANTNND
jgi:hypothetical protein